MILISHRGNIDAVRPWYENDPAYIDEAIESGYNVEIDIRFIDNELYLGHDTPDYKINLIWLLDRTDKIWIHTKNFGALHYLINKNLKTFYHQKENHTIINNSNLIWSHELSEANEKSIIPLISLNDIKNNYNIINNVYGICSDYVENLKRKNK